jgi:ABC-type transport system involved in multi-copper enzyme maturation permease subunit
MSMSPAADTDDRLSASQGKGAIVMGRRGYPFVVLRLVGMELYKLRRRAMSKVVGSIAVVLAIIPFLLVAVGTIVTVDAPLSSYQPSCGPQQGVSGSASVPPSGCPTLSPAQLQQMRNLDVQNTSEPLRLPGSLNLGVQFALIVGTALFIIVFGTMVGGDYSIGTIRLLYTRGPTRTQFLLARLGAAIFIALAGLIVMVGLGVLIGQALNPISGFAQGGDFFSVSWLGHALLYLLLAVLDWSMYGVIALFFGILGRSTVAAVVGAFSWLIAEPILSGVLGLLGGLNHGPFGDFLKAIPDYFIANNFNALEQEQSLSLSGSSTNPTISPLHAWIVIACYFAMFTGLAWWINKQRDITN